MSDPPAAERRAARPDPWLDRRAAVGAAVWGLLVALAVYVVAAVIGVAIAVASTGDVAYWTHGVRYIGAAIGWIVGTEASVVDYAGPVRLGFGGSGPAVPAVFIAALLLIVRFRREPTGVRMATFGIITAFTFATAAATSAEITARVATTDALTVRVSPGSVFTGALLVALLALVAAGVLAYRDRRPDEGWVRGSADGRGPACSCSVSEPVSPSAWCWRARRMGGSGRSSPPARR